VRVFLRERTWIRVGVEFQFSGVDPIKGLLVAENDQEPILGDSPQKDCPLTYPWNGFQDRVPVAALLVATPRSQLVFAVPVAIELVHAPTAPMVRITHRTIREVTTFLISSCFYELGGGENKPEAWPMISQTS
jgi:hypothetical protein